MLLWRIAREIHVDSALEGVGGLMVSGRWHRRGKPILYTASSAALAALEVLVHVEPLQAPDDLLPGVNYVGGSRQLRRRVLPPSPPAIAGGGDSEN